MVAAAVVMEVVVMVVLCVRVLGEGGREGMCALQCSARGSVRVRARATCKYEQVCKQRRLSPTCLCTWWSVDDVSEAMKISSDIVGSILRRRLSVTVGCASSVSLSTLRCCPSSLNVPITEKCTDSEGE